MPNQILPIQGIADVGVVKDTPATALPPNAFSDVRNVRFHSNAVRKMEGEVDLIAQYDTEGIIPAVHSWGEVKYTVWWNSPNRAPLGGYMVSIIQELDTEGSLLGDRVIIQDHTLGTARDITPTSGVFNSTGKWQHTFFQGGFALVLNNTVDKPVFILDPAGEDDLVTATNVLNDLPGWDLYKVNDIILRDTFDADEDSRIFDIGRAVDFTTFEIIVSRDDSELAAITTNGTAANITTATDSTTNTTTLTFDSTSLPDNTDISVVLRSRNPVEVSAGVIRTFGDFLVAGDITERDSVISSRPIVRRLAGVLRTSDVAPPGSIPNNWDPYAAGVSTADDFVITADGVVTDMAELQGNMFIYSNGSISAMRQTGNASIPLAVAPVTNAYGCQNTGSVLEVDGKHVVIGSQDIYVFPGHPGNIQSISDGRVRHYFFENQNPLHEANTFLVRNQSEDEVWICYPTAGSITGECDEALIWNYRHNSWTIRDLNDVWAGTVGPVRGGGIPNTVLSLTGNSGSAGYVDTGAREVQRLAIDATARSRHEGQPLQMAMAFAAPPSRLAYEQREVFDLIVANDSERTAAPNLVYAVNTVSFPDTDVLRNPGVAGGTRLTLTLSEGGDNTTVTIDANNAGFTDTDAAEQGIRDFLDDVVAYINSDTDETLSNYTASRTDTDLVLTSDVMGPRTISAATLSTFTPTLTQITGTHGTGNGITLTRTDGADLSANSHTGTDTETDVGGTGIDVIVEDVSTTQKVTITIDSDFTSGTPSGTDIAPRNPLALFPSMGSIISERFSDDLSIGDTITWTDGVSWGSTTFGSTAAITSVRMRTFYAAAGSGTGSLTGSLGSYGALVTLSNPTGVRPRDGEDAIGALLEANSPITIQDGSGGNYTFNFTYDSTGAGATTISMTINAQPTGQFFVGQGGSGIVKDQMFYFQWNGLTGSGNFDRFGRPLVRNGGRTGTPAATLEFDAGTGISGSVDTELPANLNASGVANFIKERILGSNSTFTVDSETLDNGNFQLDFDLESSVDSGPTFSLDTDNTTSSGGVSFSETSGSGTIYDITFRNTNSYEFPIISTSTGGARTMAADSEYLVRDNGTSNSWTLAYNAISTANWTATSARDAGLTEDVFNLTATVGSSTLNFGTLVRGGTTTVNTTDLATTATWTAGIYSPSAADPLEALSSETILSSPTIAATTMGNGVFGYSNDMAPYIQVRINHGDAFDVTLPPFEVGDDTPTEYRDRLITHLQANRFFGGADPVFTVGSNLDNDGVRFTGTDSTDHQPVSIEFLTTLDGTTYPENTFGGNLSHTLTPVSDGSPGSEPPVVTYNHPAGNVSVIYYGTFDSDSDGRDRLARFTATAINSHPSFTADTDGSGGVNVTRSANAEEAEVFSVHNPVEAFASPAVQRTQIGEGPRDIEDIILVQSPDGGSYRVDLGLLEDIPADTEISSAQIAQAIHDDFNGVDNWTVGIDTDSDAITFTATTRRDVTGQWTYSIIRGNTGTTESQLNTGTWTTTVNGGDPVYAKPTRVTINIHTGYDELGNAIEEVFYDRIFGRGPGVLQIPASERGQNFPAITDDTEYLAMWWDPDSDGDTRPNGDTEALSEAFSAIINLVRGSRRLNLISTDNATNLSVSPTQYSQLANFFTSFDVSGVDRTGRVAGFGTVAPEPYGPDSEVNASGSNVGTAVDLTFDPVRPWPKNQVNPNREFPIFIQSGNTNPADNDSPRYQKLSVADVGFTYGGTPYTSHVERKQLGLTPEFTTETLASVALWADGGTSTTFGAAQQRATLTVRTEGSNYPGENVILTDTDQSTLSNSFVIGDDYKIDLRTNGRFINFRIDDADTPNNVNWNVSGGQFEIMEGGKR